MKKRTENVRKQEKIAKEKQRETEMGRKGN